MVSIWQEANNKVIAWAKSQLEGQSILNIQTKNYRQRTKQTIAFPFSDCKITLTSNLEVATRAPSKWTTASPLTCARYANYKFSIGSYRLLLYSTKNTLWLTWVWRLHIIWTSRLHISWVRVWGISPGKLIWSHHYGPLIHILLLFQYLQVYGYGQVEQLVQYHNNN